MKRKALVAGVTLLMMFALLGVSPVVAKAPTPSQAEASIPLTYFSPYNSEYKIADPLIVDYDVDLLFLQAMATKTTLNLGKSVWESSFSTIVNNVEYSDTLGNNTWNTATSDGMTVNTQATANAPETLITFKATTNATAVAQNAQALSLFSYDGNDDGDYADVADKSYLPHDENVFILINNEMTAEDADDETYSTVEIILETTTSTDYTVTVKYWEMAGDSGWDFTTSNGATLEFFDCSGVPIVTVLPLADILDADSEAVNIIGSDQLKMYLYEDVASKYVQNELKNIAWFTSMPAFTDDIDGNNNWDFDSTDEYFTGIDQTNYLFTVLTQAAMDTYDSSQELLEDANDSITTKVKARYLYFEGTMAMYPYSFNFKSDVVSPGKYLVTESFSFDTREIDPLTSLTNVLSWSSWKFNVTLEDSVMWDTDNYQNNLVFFSWEGIDTTENFRGVWTTTTDDAEVQFDNADPSTTTGSLQEGTLQYYSSVSYAPTQATTTTTVTGGGGVTSASAGNPWPGILMIGALATVTIWYFKFRD